jgi:hypothetical protein
LPPMNEVMADSLKWDPLGHRWGRGAHWPLILGVGHRRERTPAQKQKRAAHRREKKGIQQGLCVGGGSVPELQCSKLAALPRARRHVLGTASGLVQRSKWLRQLAHRNTLGAAPPPLRTRGARGSNEGVDNAKVVRNSGNKKKD